MKTFTLVTLTAMTLMLSGCKDESVYFGGNCDFRLTVTDASGTNPKTIRLYVTKN